MAADLVSPESIAFMIRNGSGIISVGMKEEDLERLMIPMMSPVTENGAEIRMSESTLHPISKSHLIPDRSDLRGKSASTSELSIGYVAEHLCLTPRFSRTDGRATGSHATCVTPVASETVRT